MMKYLLLGYDREFYLGLIRMCFKIKNNILKEFYKFFCEEVCGVMIHNRLLRNTLVISMVVHVLTSRVSP